MAQTKINLATLKTTLASNMSGKVAAGFTPTYDDFTKLIEKVSDIVEFDNPQRNYLPELDGAANAGITEEMFLNLPDINTYDQNDESGRSAEGANEYVSKYLTPETCYYSYPMKTLKIKVSEPMGAFKSYTFDGGAEVVGRIIGKAIDSKVLSRNFMKKQLMGQFIKHIETGDSIGGITVGGRAEQKVPIAHPVDDTTGEAFIKKVQEVVRAAKWENTKNCLGVVQGGAPELVLFVKGAAIGASLSVDTLSGAFNKEELGLGVKVVEVPDFGNYSGDVYALLCDPRSMKLSPVWEETLSGVNRDDARIDTVFHYQDKAFYSNCTFAVVFKD